MNRNDPCPCGSGKKYKKCCMLAPASGSAAATSAVVDAEGLERHAYAHHQAGRLEQAERLYRRALTAEPDRIAAMVNLGQIREQLGDLRESAALFRRVLAIDDSSAEHCVSLASLLRRQGEAGEALRLARRGIELDPESLRAHLLTAEILDQMNRGDEARGAAERALSIAPDHGGAAVLVASLDRRAGRLDDAEQRLEQVIASESDPEHRHRAYKELGMLLDARERYDAAFDALLRGGAERARTDVARRLDRGLWGRCIADYKSRLTPELMSRWSPETIDDGRPAPAFLVGFPRSGTTMTERILAAHPGIVSTDEQPLVHEVIVEMARRLDRQGEITRQLDRLGLDDVRHLRATYWERAEAVAGDPRKGHLLLDKTPLNIMHLGLVNVIFPEARIIVALRDPRDVCLSCLMQRFGLNAAMINFLTWESTVDFYDRVMDLWLHMRDLLTVPCLEIRYEDTVRDLEGQARRMLEFLGLPWDDRVLTFHETAADRFVSTPSYAAVARPVHGGAVGRWRHYEDRVAAVMPRLQRYLDEFGYR